MVGIQDQLNLEKEMTSLGVQRYQATTRKAEEADRAAETSYGSVLMRQLVEPIAETIEERVTAGLKGKRGKYVKYLRMIDMVGYTEVAYLALKEALNACACADTRAVSLMVAIGKSVEQEIRYSHFKEHHKEYFDAMVKGIKRKKTQSKRHLRRALAHAQSNQGYTWNSWSTDDCSRVGSVLIECLLNATDLFKKELIYKETKKYLMIGMTPEAQEWVNKHKELRELQSPVFMPMIVEPLAWNGMHDGGYLSGALRQRYAFIRGYDPKYEDKYTEDAMRMTYDQVSAIQSTAWQVNKPILEIIERIWDRNLGIVIPKSEPIVVPPSKFIDRPKEDLSPLELDELKEYKMMARDLYNKESKRKALCYGAVSMISTANRFKDYEKIYFPMNCDTRGRVYSIVPLFNPQGDDVAKGMLRFAEGKPLGPTGFKWLCVHGANKYGYDKDTYEGRVEWIKSHHDEILQLVTDPIRHTDFWLGADKPVQFLAFCFEYAEAYRDPENFVSHLPCALDGSCNGLQHFSAMLRDEVGGTSTNLTPQAIPADIYTDVAKVCTAKVKASDIPTKDLWLKLFNDYGDGQMPRKLAKKPVMTLPYGATKYGCTDSIIEWLDGIEELENIERFGAAKDMTNLLWESISEVVVASRQIMDWLQQGAKAISKKEKLITWTTPNGFPVIQTNYKVKLVTMSLFFEHVILVAAYTDDINAQKQTACVSPNFVHSMDACHMLRVVRAAQCAGIKDFACIHDDFGTHAANTGLFQQLIQGTFTDMYSRFDPVDNFYRQYEEYLDAPPPKGTLDIDKVMKSKYFFG